MEDVANFVKNTGINLISPADVLPDHNGFSFNMVGGNNSSLARNWRTKCVVAYYTLSDMLYGLLVKTPSSGYKAYEVYTGYKTSVGYDFKCNVARQIPITSFMTKLRDINKIKVTNKIIDNDFLQKALQTEVAKAV